MAFQSDPPFADFMRRTSSTAVFADSAPAVNFLLDERLPRSRELTFLAQPPTVAANDWNCSRWRQKYGNFYSEKIALPQHRAIGVSTFADENQDNHLSIESHQDVVRLESLLALYQRYQGDFDSVSDLAAELRNLIQSKVVGNRGAFSEDQLNRLTVWLDGLNERRDARPAFAAPFGELEQVVNAPDWATTLRNMLGLSHLGGSTTKPLPVVMCRYNLSRVERAARKAKAAAWAAVPTVLEAGGVSGPGSAFFPYPKAAAGSNPFGFGITVCLASDGDLDFKSELLHFRLDYTLDDFVMLGELIDEVTEVELARARQQHFDLLEQDFHFRSDVP